MMLSPELLPLFEGVFPSCIVTSSAEGIPNIANLTRVWYAGSNGVAVANQLLNKTHKNLMENPLALLKMVNPQDLAHWEIPVRYIGFECEGPLFEQVKQDLLTVSWFAGIPLPAELKSVLVFEVMSTRPCVEEAIHLRPAPEIFSDLLNVLAAMHDWSRCSFWVAGENDEDVKLQASRGVPGAGVEAAVFGYIKRLVSLVKKEQRIIRIKNVRSLLRYIHSIRTYPQEHERDEPSDFPLTESMPSSFLAFPIIEGHSVIGIICCEDVSGQPGTVHAIDDRYLILLAGKIGEALRSASSVSEQERGALFKQVVDRVKLQWAKETDPFHSILSARERQVAIHVAKGYTNAEIAKLLFISPRTVTTHLERIYQKLHVSSRSALTRYVMEKELFPEDAE